MQLSVLFENQAMSKRRRPMRVVKAYDEFQVKTGTAGFVQLIKNGKRIQPKNYERTFRVRRRGIHE